MKRIVHALLPTPVLSIALLVLWLLLNRSMSAGHILLGTLLALAIPRLTAGLRPLPVHIHSPWAAFKLACTVVVDTTQSNMPWCGCCCGPALESTRRVLCAFPWRCATPTPWQRWP